MATDIENKTEGPGTVSGSSGVNSKFLQRGKYFLFGILVLGQLVGAYIFIDNYYQDMYMWVFGSLPDHSVTYKMDEIIANPKGSNAQRFLLIEIGMELHHSDHVELVDRNLMKIRDRANMIISSRTFDELLRFDERERLRNELAEEVNNAIGVRSVRNLYFIKYVMQ
ncbi:MAG: flagellar basal body-associated FliL family protein [Balneolales bacterium]